MGVTQLTAIQASTFQPTIWSGALLHNYYEISALPLITKKAPKIVGNQLVYNLASPISVNLTTTGVTDGTIDLQSIDTTALKIDMDQVAQWGFQIQNLTEVQTNLDLISGEMYEAAMGNDQAISQQVYQDIFKSAGINLGTVTINTINAYDTLVNMAMELNKAKVPKFGRYFVIDNDFLGMLAKDYRFTADPNVLANGIVEGRKIAGCEIVVTTELNYTPATTGTNPTNATGQAFLIQKDGYGWGMQFDEIQYIDKTLGKMVKAVQGQSLYGFGVLRPNNIIACTTSYSNAAPEEVELPAD